MAKMVQSMFIIHKIFLGASNSVAIEILEDFVPQKQAKWCQPKGTITTET